MPERVAREVRLPRVLVQDSLMGLKERRDRRPGNGAEDLFLRVEVAV